jgi:hypothetical protein
MIKGKFTLEEAMNAQMGSRGLALLFTSVLDGVSGQRHAPAALPRGKRSSTHCTGGWLVLRAGLDRHKKSRPHQNLITGPSSPLHVTIPTTLSQSMKLRMSGALPLLSSVYLQGVQSDNFASSCKCIVVHYA